MIYLNSAHISRVPSRHFLPELRLLRQKLIISTIPLSDHRALSDFENQMFQRLRKFQKRQGRQNRQGRQSRQ